ncbi:unnamed protein product [Ceratitis capitata]|uniref:(Mediterranean fruit fly) hypothetical protein n=1 Tax=Ceratitis capitata TaxID=7213 RepID=A0A811URW7_CERCA|nr:unnamed protein product [Ceratitis capitata]
MQYVRQHNGRNIIYVGPEESTGSVRVSQTIHSYSKIIFFLAFQIANRSWIGYHIKGKLISISKNTREKEQCREKQ